GGRVARITTAGVITELGVPIFGSLPKLITLGPDGVMWFTENGSNRIGRISTTGKISKFDLPIPNGGPSGIAGRADGTLWFSLYNVERLGHTLLAAAEPTRSPTATATSTS